MLKERTVKATTSSKLMKPLKKLSLLPELLLLFLTFQKLLLSAQKNMDKELSINSGNILDALPALQQDGFPVLLPIKSPKNSKNQEFLLLLIPKLIIKLLLKLHM